MIKLFARKSGVSEKTGGAYVTVRSWPAHEFAAALAPLFAIGDVSDFIDLVNPDGTPCREAPPAGAMIEVTELRTRPFHVKEGEGDDAKWSTRPNFKIDAVVAAKAAAK